jgi:hypothetical protein
MWFVRASGEEPIQINVMRHQVNTDRTGSTLEATGS